MTRLPVALALSVLPGLALAQTQPRLVPSTDASIVYRVSGPAVANIPGGAPNGVRLVWDAAGERLRGEPVGGAVYAIADLGRHLAEVVLGQQSTYFELPLREGNPQALLNSAVPGADAQFTRGAPAQVIGIPCTEWTVHARKLDGTACVTADGLVLRAAGTWNGQSGAAEALSVSRDHAPAELFRPPEGFFRINLKGGQ